ncbi:ATP-binding protein [Nocardia transvalensis]|uniref:ATP-binding protein n=1 Tax=Nocardia transvalensis TaxID=37333 RepID=UPI0018950FF4|nr:ATP-binding protein [Nocardia transvalensis]MBF6333469.1 ATP-binding protein [Nocardia transvalensis]
MAEEAEPRGGTEAARIHIYGSARMEFARSLSQLFAAAGNPPISTVWPTTAIGRLHTSKSGRSPVRHWLSGSVLPDSFTPLRRVLEVLIYLVRTRDQEPSIRPELLDLVAWKRLWLNAIQDEELTNAAYRASADEDVPPPPYPGIAAFNENNADLFFGREQDTGALTAYIQAVAMDITRPSLLILVGAAGVGKTSLLSAGVVPALASSRHWSTQLTTPGPERDPLHALTDAAMHLELDQQCEQRLLIVDQFEELFTHDERTRGEYLAHIESLTAEARDNPTVVLLSVRADYYRHCLDHPVLARPARHSLYKLEPVTEEALPRIITQPAAARGTPIEADLPALVINDLLGTPPVRTPPDAGTLTLLSQTMRQTYIRGPRKLTTSAYSRSGGVTSTSVSIAADAWSRLTAAEQQIGKALLLALTAFDDDGHLVRRRLPRDELLQHIDNPDQATAALDNLIRHHLLTEDLDAVYLTIPTPSAWLPMLTWRTEFAWATDHYRLPRQTLPPKANAATDVPAAVAEPVANQTETAAARPVVAHQTRSGKSFSALRAFTGGVAATFTFGLSVPSRRRRHRRGWAHIEAELRNFYTRLGPPDQPDNHPTAGTPT